jgi:hypothetical protein
VFHAINAVLIPAKGVAAGRRRLLGGGPFSAGAVGQYEATEANLDAQQEAILWEANSGQPGSLDVDKPYNHLVAVPSWASQDW